MIAERVLTLERNLYIRLKIILNNELVVGKNISVDEEAINLIVNSIHTY
jgi:hypothetical protein